MIRRFVFNPVQVNCYVLADEEAGEAAVVDCGATSVEELAPLMQYLTEAKLKPACLLNTHGHFDHVWGNAVFHELTGLRPRLSEADLSLYQHLSDQVRTIMGVNLQLPVCALGEALADGAVVTFGSCHIRVMATPGHTPGGVSLYIPDWPDGSLVLTGDTLFRGSVGRTDLPGGNPAALGESVRKLLTLPDEVRVYPGHGPSSTIGYERMHNPFA